MTTSLFIWQSTPPIISQVKQSFRHKYTKQDVDEAYKKYSELVGFCRGENYRILHKIDSFGSIWIF